MKKESAEPTRLHGEKLADFSGHRMGRIVELSGEGHALVIFPGNHGVPVRARSVLDAPPRAGEHPAALVGASVLLLFEDADPARPVIVGLVRDTLRPEPGCPEVALDLGNERDVVVDGQRLVFDAKREILLRCGKSSVLLRRDGKVLIRGEHLVSRASGPNKIKGGSISLN